MITVISGTNRPGSNTEIFAKYYYEVLKKKADEEVKFLSLERLNTLEVLEGMYNAEKQCDTIRAIQDEYILPADKFVFVTPEYNGSFPGIFKYFLDAVSIREYQKAFKGKKALLAGVATGRAGNLRGMGHLSDVLMHVGMHVHPAQMPYSKVGAFIKNGKLTDKETRKVVREHAKNI